MSFSALSISSGLTFVTVLLNLKLGHKKVGGINKLMDDKNGIQVEVIAEIAKHLGVTVQDIDVNAGLSGDLGLGPVEMADLISAISQKFNVTFNPSELHDIKTVNDLVVAVEDLSLE